MTMTGLKKERELGLIRTKEDADRISSEINKAAAAIARLNFYSQPFVKEAMELARMHAANGSPKAMEFLRKWQEK